MAIGEKCVINAECSNYKCNNGECQVYEEFSLGANCEGYGYCEQLSHCVDNICVKYALFGESFEEAVCLPGLVCGEAKKCVKKFTQETGKEADSGGYACISGVNEKNDDGKYVCVEFKSVEDECELNDYCKVTYTDGTKDYEEIEQCQSKANGSKVCPLFSNSDQWKKYVEEYNNADEDLENNDYLEISNYIWLDDNSVLEAYVDFEKGVTIGEEDCIRDYFITQKRSNGSFSSFSKFLVLFFAFLK